MQLNQSYTLEQPHRLFTSDQLKESLPLEQPLDYSLWSSTIYHSCWSSPPSVSRFGASQSVITVGAASSIFHFEATLSIIHVGAASFAHSLWRSPISYFRWSSLIDCSLWSNTINHSRWSSLNDYSLWSSPINHSHWSGLIDFILEQRAAKRILHLWASLSIFHLIIRFIYRCMKISKDIFS